MHTRPTNTAGFTLVETLVAVLLLSTSLIAIVSILTRALTITTYAQQRFTATKIALQGIELIRNKRDNNVMCWESASCPSSVTSWKSNLVGAWEPDITDVISIYVGNSFDTASGRQLCISTQTGTLNGRYTYCDGAQERPLPGGYTRRVTVTDISPYSVAVDCTVTWNGGQSLTLNTVLFQTKE